MLEFLRRQLTELLQARTALKEARDGTIAAAQTEKRASLSEDETAAYAAAQEALAAHDTLIEQVRAQIDVAVEAEAREARVAQAAAAAGTTGPGNEARAQVTGEPETYRRGGQNSYFRDLTLANIRQNQDAADRLRRNDREQLEVRGLTTTDGAGGEFVPPAWLLDEYVKLARAGRVVADQVRQMELPAGTDSVNLPRVATGTATAEQATQNTAVQDTDATTNSVESKVATIAGKQIVAVQLLEQSPMNMDEVILADLAADYATKLDVFVINNNAAGKRGLLNVTGVNAVAYTDATPTVAELYPKIADGIQQIHTGRFMPATKIFMHPRRWAWFTAAVDTAGRPLVVPASNIPQNVLAAMGDVVAEGFVGLLQGLPVYVDPNIPINLGAGTNEDRIVIAKADDVILMEGSPRAEAFRETKADQLSVLLRFYNYAAVASERYPKSLSVIAGTGLITPTF